LQGLRNTHSDRHHEQILHGVKVGLHVDKEYGQIYVSGLPLEELVIHRSNAARCQSLQLQWRAGLRRATTPAYL